MASDHARKRSSDIARGCLGNLVEWYDWFVYAWFGLYFAGAFFPSHDPTAQLLATAVVFAIGFLMRPLGGWLLGLYADRFGRRPALTLSVSLMAAGSLAIAVNPGYSVIGVGAPVLLIVARMVQGLSVGGEYGTSASYLNEVAHSRRRVFCASFQYVSIVLGQLLALLTLIVMQHTMSEASLTAWGWRIPFALGAVLGLTVFYLRRHMGESEAHMRHQRESRAGRRQGMSTLLREHRGQLAVAVALSTGGSVAWYTYTTYLPKYFVTSGGLDRNDMAVVGFAALVVLMLLQPLAGLLADRFGRRVLLIVSAVGTIAVTVPIFTLARHTTNLVAVFALMVLGLFFLAGFLGAPAELFPTHLRALGLGVGHSIATAAFGGTVETVALELKELGLGGLFPWYVVVMAAVMLAAALLLPRVTTSSLDEAPEEQETSSRELETAA
jgi:MHS family alpha-ketoglutarate permease-like MFS transporter